MKDFIKKKGLPILIVVVLVAVLFGVVRYALAGRAGLLSNAVGAVRAPLARSAVAVTEWLESIYGYIYKYDQLVEQNEALQKSLAEAEEKARLGEEALEENARLRELLNLAEKRTDFVFESAKIISWDPSNWTSRFTIGKGASSGIELGDCVVTEYEALVGQVVELGDNWATVRTLVDVDFGAGALVGASGEAAMVIGDYMLMQDNCLRLAYLTDSSGVFEGDAVLTSGEGGAFPQGLIIGEVTALRSDDGGQSVYGVVRPALDVSHLTQVFVIKDYEITE
ncbi:MAG: rod shape-determining protein MreC [Oscillospiraceae bacterium]|nr:rod shape-determining protein MreC [Oscillospiraceae bacterium]